jgi:hypothetical protein
MRKLTALQKRFCDILVLMEIAGKSNQAEAYKLAGSKCKGKTLEQEASRTARKPQVLKYLARRRARYSSKIEKTGAEIIAEYEKIAFVNLADYYNDDFTLKPISSLTDHQKAALHAIEIEELEYVNKKGKKITTRKIKIKLHSKKGALDSLARIKGLMKGDIDDAVNTLAKAIKEANESKGSDQQDLAESVKK